MRPDTEPAALTCWLLRSARSSFEFPTWQVKELVEQFDLDGTGKLEFEGWLGQEKPGLIYFRVMYAGRLQRTKNSISRMLSEIRMVPMGFWGVKRSSLWHFSRSSFQQAALDGTTLAVKRLVQSDLVPKCRHLQEERAALL